MKKRWIKPAMCQVPAGMEISRYQSAQSHAGSKPREAMQPGSASRRDQSADPGEFIYRRIGRVGGAARAAPARP